VDREDDARQFPETDAAQLQLMKGLTALLALSFALAPVGCESPRPRRPAAQGDVRLRRAYARLAEMQDINRRLPAAQKVFAWAAAEGDGGVVEGVLLNYPRAFQLPNTMALRANAIELARRNGHEAVAQLIQDYHFPGMAVVTAAAPPQAPKPQAPAAPAGPRSDVDAPGYRLNQRPDDFALIIGVETYQSLPKADDAVRDARTVRKHLEALGVPSRNIVSLEGETATKSKLQSYLQEWLPLNVKDDSTLFVYYSGHGAPDPTDGGAYLVPWDGDPKFLKSSAYPLKQFYADLAKTKAKRIVVALDACFSGAGGRSVLAKGARPLVVNVDSAAPAEGNMTVLAAASGDEITGVLDEQGHGLFTYYFLKGLSGFAKNADGNVTPKSLYDYLKPRVQDEARRQNRAQSPTFSGGTDDAPLARF
jgi:hypothetical protein